MIFKRIYTVLIYQMVKIQCFFQEYRKYVTYISLFVVRFQYLYILFLITDGIRAELKPTNSLGVCPPAPNRPGCSQWKLDTRVPWLHKPVNQSLVGFEPGVLSTFPIQLYHSTMLVSVLILISSDIVPSDLVYSIKKCLEFEIQSFVFNPLRKFDTKIIHFVYLNDIFQVISKIMENMH